MRPYKTNNGRIIHRKRNGRFRQTTLKDVGMGHCEKCGKIFTPERSRYEDGGFIDPMKYRESFKVCNECEGNNDKS